MHLPLLCTDHEIISELIDPPHLQNKIIVPTLTTVPLIALLFILWPLTGRQILSVVVFTSVFSAASAMDFGSMGLACWLFALLALGAFKILQGNRSYQITGGINRIALFFVFAFVAYAFMSGMVFPFVFAGIPVVRADHTEPLAWGMANVAQLGYLGAAFVLYLMAIASSKKELDQALVWYVRGCVAAACIAFYQLLNAVAHVPYPTAVLYSNRSYVIFPAYQIDGMWRLNGPFTEASDMAGFMIAGVALTGWAMIHRPLRLGRCLSFLTMLLALVLTDSSVGYATVALLAAMGIFVYLRYLWRGGALSQGKVLIVILVVGLVTTCIFVKPSSVDAVRRVVTTTLLEKQNSESFHERTQTHVDAMATLANTTYIGAGWGSTRASGLLYVLLANTGVIGTALFLLMLLSFCLPMLKRAKRAHRAATAIAGTQEDFSLGAILFAMLMLLITMVAAGSELGMPILWVLFGAATIATAREPIQHVSQLSRTRVPVRVRIFQSNPARMRAIQ